MVERWVSAYGREAALKICEYDQREPVHGIMFSGIEPAEDAPQMDDGSRLVANLRQQRFPSSANGRRGVGLLRCSGRKDADVGLAACGRGDTGDGRQRKAVGSHGGAAAALSLCAAGALRGDGCGSGWERERELLRPDPVRRALQRYGTLARNPEIRHRLRAEDLPRQATRQRAILSQTLGGWRRAADWCMPPARWSPRRTSAWSRTRRPRLGFGEFRWLR